MTKLIELNEEACRGLEWDMNAFADAVRVTLDPKGCNVVFGRKWGTPIITSDGVSIVKEIELDDPYEKIGTELVREAVKKADDVTDDGTTAATVVAQTVVREGLCNATVDANPMALKKGMEVAVAVIVGKLSRLAIDIEAKEQIVATMSISAADSSIDEVIAEAMDKVGKEGAITVKESSTPGLELKLTEGVYPDKGYISPYSVVDVERTEAILDDLYVLIADSKISSLEDPLPVLKKVMQSGESLLVVVEDVESEVLAGLIVNKLRGTFKPIAVKVPGFGDHHRAMLGDTAILTGGQVTVEEVGLSLEAVTLDPLGRARQVTVTKDEYAIIDGNGAQARIEGRIAQIRRKIENPGSDYGRGKLRERLAKPIGSMAVIRVGVATKVKLKGRKHRIKDTVRSAKATVEEGIVLGGGVALLQTFKAVKVEGLDDDKMIGTNIVFIAAQVPLCQIAMNAVLEDGVTMERVTDLLKGHGLDAVVNEYVDIVAAGIIDPAKVTHLALQNAALIVALFLTTEIVIADKPEKTPVAADVPGMDEMDGMGDL